MPTHQDSIYTGIEIGTSCIKVAISSVSNDNSITLLGWGEVPSVKVIKGVVKDYDFVSDLIARAVMQAEKEAGISIAETTVVLSVDSRFMKLVPSEGVVGFDGQSMRITEDHIVEAEREALYETKDDSEKVEAAFTRYYSIDNGEIFLAPPVGKFSTFLKIHNEYLVCLKREAVAYASIIQSTTGVEPDMMAYTPMALAFALSVPNNATVPSDGFLLIDIGAGVTSYVLCTERDFFTMGQITVGCDHAANDLYVSFGIPINSARNIIRDMENLRCSVIPSNDDAQRLIAVDMEGKTPKQNISALRVEEIMYVRFKELFNIINKKIKDEDAWQWATGGVLLCGGGAQIPKIKELASSTFNRPVGIARAVNVKGRADVVESPAALVPLGLARYGRMSTEVEKQNHPKDKSGKVKNFISELFNF